VGSGRSEQLLVISDDGALQIRGEECKKLKDPNLRRFRTITVALETEAARQLARPWTGLRQP
jgi:hypothetical protein